MRRTGTLGLLAAAMLAVFALAGCGQDQVKANNRYVAATDRVVQAFETKFQALQADFTPVSTPPEDLRTLALLQAAVAQVVQDLGRIQPPAKIAGLHEALIAHTREYETVIKTAETGLKSQDLTKIAAARSRFSSQLAAVATKITDTINTINAALK
ncbi:hypothetical protein NBH00_21020 [Paraconexibacter antarcticus]|uniref:Lipoprotein n=1 Tax=Paraconexibacter antarcticus TaxID=2949664 RepID=A0ABY5DP59_9ACTN|nr:hypothetical protein [Paraconexibacter antarcticus]UTI63813.1 hypothetical protein NBH00_21020 [Paraconexibacter antarcticus]